MSDTSDTYVVCLSGPKEARAKALVGLELAGVPLLPDDHHDQMDWRSKLGDDESVGYTACVAQDVNVPVRAVADAGWRLRMHGHLRLKAPEPSPEYRIAATMAEMEARIAALEAATGRAGR